MIKVGTDICSVRRISEAYGRFGDRFLKRIFTSTEIEYVLSQPRHTLGRIAGRFAAKEAACKALGTGWHGVGWKEIEIIRQRSGAPALLLHGRARNRAATLGLTEWEVSLSHEHDYATACVIAYGSQ